ncbi:hypothetical protein CLAFUW4_12413 [Fulvia fulva]|uniref:DUF2278 family protein n=1 Tax=Passalora fulva TaxID=5499 RepID=A0A9Q8PEF0_PASFU|nr:uncharacterized protein CLAFUR5_11441 [Fulvia fulva]KAK4617693.1 hypothetical protein CLAFUR4_12418 [Fulvia fulva]KAK4619070.1 hypothetical protein CLAFUR0_12429 [Fulvia fulva]UJO20911.1 hypothetical protein CLAFUR5_11441 [Fulvia fulva]WPV17983.1 hypothetical protein CLAFUW4_12413 [Fulvia fulva]WPV32838.1 hypothetical protein CLAFUW7_12420 [Fulvia fulva]
MSKSYGVWVANPVSYSAQTPKQDSKSPHITLNFTDGSNGGEAEINVKSTDKDTRLVYWVNQQSSHPITKSLANLDLGPRTLGSANNSDLALDFQRTQPALLHIDKGQVLDSYEKGPNNDILEKLEPILDQAIKEKATMYLYGQSYHDSDGQSGIHDFHMNQGYQKGYSNALYSDGSFFIKFNDGHWEAVFLAFASQSLPTDDSGDPTSGAETFEQRLGSSSSK